MKLRDIKSRLPVCWGEHDICLSPAGKDVVVMHIWHLQSLEYNQTKQTFEMTSRFKRMYLTRSLATSVNLISYVRLILRGICMAELLLILNTNSQYTQIKFTQSGQRWGGARSFTGVAGQLIVNYDQNRLLFFIWIIKSPSRFCNILLHGYLIHHFVFFFLSVHSCYISGLPKCVCISECVCAGESVPWINPDWRSWDLEILIGRLLIGLVPVPVKRTSPNILEGRMCAICFALIWVLLCFKKFALVLVNL